MKYYIIAGEASGDLHGSNLMKALKKEDAAADFRIWGGDLMQAAGGDVRKHYRDLAFMGFLEVVKNLRTIFANIRFCKSDILDYQPDVLILIDYPGFNLRIAKWAKANNIRIFYYISPQIWAWHTSRVHNIKKWIDKMFVILPFEQDFYQKYDYKADFVGHPLLDAIAQFEPDTDFRQNNNLGEKPILALLPGSRKQEIAKVLPEMLSSVAHFADYQFVIAGAPAQTEAFYQDILRKYNQNNNIKIVFNQTYQLLYLAKAALVTSGTATLETALFDVPEVVCYKGSAVSYHIAKRLIDLKYISLVNLIADEEVVKELIQDECNEKAIVAALKNILNADNQLIIKEKYALLKQKLGNIGASERCAELMVNALKMDNLKQ
jgi:lipid-A-disaccharide synthase